MDSILLTLLSNQNACFFRRTSVGKYQLIHQASWANMLFPGISTNKPISISNHSFFIDDFVDELEQDWLKTNSPILHSGIWSEQLTDGSTLRLEAEAFRSDGDIYLFIKNLAQSFQEKQKTLQAAREAVIANEQLLKNHLDSQDRLQALIKQTPNDDLLLDTLSKAIDEMDVAVIVCNQKYENIIENPAAKYLFEQQNQGRDSLTITLELLDRQYPNFAEQLTQKGEWKGEVCWVKPPFNLRWLKLSVTTIIFILLFCTRNYPRVLRVLL